MRWILLLLTAAGGALGVAALLRAPEAPRTPLVRLVDRLAEARRVEQRVDLIEPEVLHLKPGALVAPAGWLSIPDDGTLFSPGPSPRPIHLRVEVPIEGGRDYVVDVRAVDPDGKLRVLVEHAEKPGGWHRATEERAAGGRVRFDWREDTPAGEKTLPVVIESDSIGAFRIQSLTVRETGARDPAIVEAAPAVALHGLVDRAVEGATSAGKRGARRLLPSLLASDAGVYEWTLPEPPPAELRFSTATVPRGADSGVAPTEMRVEILDASEWRTMWRGQRGVDKDTGGWRAVTLRLPSGTRGLRLSTRAIGAGRPGVVAWGNPVLRDAPSSRRHVLLITLDAVRPDHLGAYGYSRATSPFLDGLAKKGARFTDVTAQRSHTWASTTSLLSGLLPQSSGVVARGDRPLRGLGGLAPAFARAGYATVRIGSADLPRGQLPGFDDTEIADNDADVMARLGELGRAYADGPLFLWVHVSTAHYPWAVADEFNRFDPGWSGPFKSGLTRTEFRALLDAGPIPDPLRRHLTALYDAAILQMDQRLGATLATLDDTGFFDDAIVAVTADHGAHFGEHDVWFMHSTPWHASLAVPLTLIAPGQIAPGSVIQSRALLVDVAPTLLDLAGLPFENLDGQTLRPALNGGALADRTIVTRFDPASYVIVENDRWRLLWNPKREPLSWPGEVQRALPLPALALFDRAADPGETHDVSAAHSDVVAALQKAAERDSADRAAGAGAHLSSEARRLLQQAGYLDDK
jgi:arylsulfatase A-like enzyme